MAQKFNPLSGTFDIVLDKASEIINTPSGNLAATDVQSALNELQGDINTINTDIADDVEGPASSTNTAIARFDGTTGKLLKNSPLLISDAADLTGLGTISATSSGATNTISVTHSGAGDAIQLTHSGAGEAVHIVTGNLKLSPKTANTAIYLDSNKRIQSSATTDTELGYVSGVTSAIQTQLNAKQATITGAATTITSSNLTVSRAVVSDGSGKVAAATTTATEIGYVNGVTSAIQTQLNAKQATITGAATTITSSDLTVSRALVSDGSGKVAVATTTSTEIGYVNGVTSAIQTQINGKMTNPMTTGGDVIYGGASGTPTRLANGSSGQVLTSAGSTSAPTWATPAKVLISTQTASSSATIDFTSIANSTYSSYEIVVDNIVPATNAVYLLFRFSVGGTFQTTDYSWQNYRNIGGGSGINGSDFATAQTSIVIGSTTDTFANSGSYKGGFFSIKISNCAQTNTVKRVAYTGNYFGSGTLSVTGGGAFAPASSAVDGFRFLFNSGNITSGTFKLYGLT